MSDCDYTVTLSPRELVLVRVALLQRLDRLRNNPSNQTAEEVHASYLETRALLDQGGKLALDTVQAAKAKPANPNHLKNRDLANLLSRAAAQIENTVRSHDIEGQDLIEDLLSAAGALPNPVVEQRYVALLRDCLRDFETMVTNELTFNGRKPHVSMQNCRGQWESLCRDARNLLNREA